MKTRYGLIKGTLAFTIISKIEGVVEFGGHFHGIRPGVNNIYVGEYSDKFYFLELDTKLMYLDIDSVRNTLYSISGPIQEVDKLTNLFENMAELRWVDENLLMYNKEHTSAAYMFAHSKKFNMASFSFFVDVPITNFSHAFYNTGIWFVDRALIESINIDYSSVNSIDMSYMFSNCKKLVDVRYDSFPEDCYNFIFNYIFSGCDKLVYVPEQFYKRVYNGSNIGMFDNIPGFAKPPMLEVVMGKSKMKRIFK